MNIYGLSISKFFVAILVGIILSVPITILMTPDYDHVDSKPIQVITVQPTIQTATNLQQLSDTVEFQVVSLGLLVIPAIFIIFFIANLFVRCEGQECY